MRHCMRRSIRLSRANNCVGIRHGEESYGMKRMFKLLDKLLGFGRLLEARRDKEELFYG